MDKLDKEPLEKLSKEELIEVISTLFNIVATMKQNMDAILGIWRLKK